MELPPPSAVRPPLVVEPKPQPKPEPKPEQKPEPEPKVKPDIAVKEEKSRRKRNLRRRNLRRRNLKTEPKKRGAKKVEPKKDETKKPESDRRPNFDDELKQGSERIQRKGNAREQNARINAELNQMGQLKGELAATATSEAWRVMLRKG